MGLNVCTSSGSPNRRFPTIILIDADSFEVQVWVQNLHKELIGQDVPIVVINPAKIILAANYRAKQLGVSRQCKLADILHLEKSMGLKIISTGLRSGLWCDTFTPMKEGNRILFAARTAFHDIFGPLVKIEKVSNDEFYVDVTMYANSICNLSLQAPRLAGIMKSEPYHDTHKYLIEVATRTYSGDDLNSISNIQPNENIMLTVAEKTEKVLREIKSETGYVCSAGIGPNKVIAKVAVGCNKPDGITIISKDGFRRATHKIKYSELPGLRSEKGIELDRFVRQMKPHFQLNFIRDVRSLGQKFLELFYRRIECEQPTSKAELLLELANGIDDISVADKVYQKNLRFTYSFTGDRAMKDLKDYRAKVGLMGEDMEERFLDSIYTHSIKPTRFDVRPEFWKPTKSLDGNLENRTLEFNLFNDLPESWDLADHIASVLEDKGFADDVTNIKKIQFSAEKFVPMDENDKLAMDGCMRSRASRIKNEVLIPCF